MEPAAHDEEAMNEMDAVDNSRRQPRASVDNGEGAPRPSVATASPDGGWAEQILRARAQRLAEVPSHDEVRERVDVLVFRVRDEHYAFRAALLRMVHRGTSLTPVPCTPPFVAGMLNVRGEVLTVLDLGVALGLHGTPPTDDASSILLAECAGIRVGLLVDEVIGMRPLALNTMDAPLSGNNYALGIAEARIVFLDLEQLLLSGRFDVLEDVS
jgi:purine-binding chemotaxis protein CheW